MSSHLYRQYDPLRSLDWRWQRVQFLLGHPEVNFNGKTDDRYICKTVRFMRAMKASPNRFRGELFSKEPGLFYLESLRQSEDFEIRSMIESRILARQTDAEIAAMHGTMPQTIEYYEALLYNVRDRMDCRDWLVRKIMGPVVDREADIRRKEITHKFFAYFGGPKILEIVRDGFDSANPPSNDADRWFDRHAQNTIRRRVATETMTAEFNRFNITELLNVYARMMEVMRQEGKGTGARDALVEGIVEACGGISLTVGGGKRFKDTVAESPLKVAYSTPGELRTEEMLALSEEGIMPEDIDKSHFPSPQIEDASS